METRVAVMRIIVENMDSVEPLNALLHENGKYIIGRMGIPYHKREISIISIALDAPQDAIAALAGKVGKTARNAALKIPAGFPLFIGGSTVGIFAFLATEPLAFRSACEINLLTVFAHAKQIVFICQHERTR